MSWFVWREQVDVRPITVTGDGSDTDAMVAAYLAKYATKSTEVTGHASRRHPHRTPHPRLLARW